MNFLANENCPLAVVEALREVGHDVAWVRADSPGVTDPEVLRRAVAERRVVLTFDKDFGELAFRSRLPSDCGVVLFRLRAASAAELAALVTAVIQSRRDWAGGFFVVDPNRIRQRSLPPP